MKDRSLAWTVVQRSLEQRFRFGEPANAEIGTFLASGFPIPFNPLSKTTQAKARGARAGVLQGLHV